MTLHGWVFGGGPHSARNADGVCADAWPAPARVPAPRRRFAHPALPAILDQVRRGDVWLIVRERIAGPSLSRIVRATVEQGAQLEPAWALAIVHPIADLLARPARARMPARIGLDSIVVDVDGHVRFVGFEHWAPTTPLRPSGATAWEPGPDEDTFALTGVLFALLTGQSPTPEREQLAALRTRLSHVDDDALRDGLASLCAKNLQAQPLLRQSAIECLSAIDRLRERAPATTSEELRGLVAGLFPDEAERERARRDEP